MLDKMTSNDTDDKMYLASTVKVETIFETPINFTIAFCTADARALAPGGMFVETDCLSMEMPRQEIMQYVM